MFWRRVIPEPNSGCWLWEGAFNKAGYGNVSYDGEYTSAHRQSWVLTFRSIPDDLDVCHKCDFPPCCNPNHLFLGTQRDNMQDCSKKGRTGAHRFPTFYSEHMTALNKKRSNAEIEQAALDAAEAGAENEHSSEVAA